MRIDVAELTNKIERELKDLTGLYAAFNKEIELMFKEELSLQDGKMEGLEDFYGLKIIVGRNNQNVNNALGMLSRIRDISSFNISEIADK